MDIYTAARRIGRAIPIDGTPPTLGRHGAIGDGFTCALVGIDGSAQRHICTFGGTM